MGNEAGGVESVNSKNRRFEGKSGLSDVEIGGVESLVSRGSERALSLDGRLLR